MANKIKDMLDEEYCEHLDELFIKQMKKLREKNIFFSVEPLQRIVIKSIAKNINFWMDFLPQKSSKYLYVISPFDIIGSQNTLAILRSLVEQGIFQVNHLNLIFHIYLTSMNFSILNRYSIHDNTFNMLLNRCKRIKRLEFTSCPIKIMNAIPQNYPELEYLAIKISECEYELIEMLTRHCVNLKTLDIICLKGNKQLIGKLEVLQKLYSLSLTGVEWDSHKTFEQLLSALNQLQYLKLTECWVNFSAMSSKKQYANVISLELSFISINDNGMLKIASTMMNLTCFKFNIISSITTQFFRHLTNLKKLTILHSAFCGEFKLNFDSFVEYFFIKSGANLIELGVSGMHCIDFQVISQCCQNLERLCVEDCFSPKVQRNLNMDDDHTLSNEMSLLESCINLKQLSLSCTYVSQLEEIFRGCDNLTALKLTLINSPTVCADDFINFFCVHQFNDLVELNLNNNRSVTKEVIKFILESSCPKIKKLSFVNCNLLKEELHHIQKLVTDSGLDLKLIHGDSVPRRRRRGRIN